MTANLNHKQQVLYSTATEADKRFRRVKLEAAAEAQRIVDESIAQAKAERDLAVRRAFDGGVRKAFFRRKDGGLHTTNPRAIDDVLAATEHLVEQEAAVTEAVQVAEGGARYRLEGEVLVITAPRDEVDAIVQRNGLEMAPDYEVRASGVRNGRLVLVTESSVPIIDPETGEPELNMFNNPAIEAHPAVTWFHQGDNEAKAVTFYQENAA